MTETPQQQGARPDDAPHGAPPGLDREGLRNFDRLRRSTSDRKIAGVAGGLGRHLDIDPTIVRVLLVVLIFFGGAGLLLYAVGWLLVPEDGSDEAIIMTRPGARNVALISGGVVAALLVVGDSWGGVGFPWPLAIVALVLVLILVNRDRRSSPAQPPSSGWVGDTDTSGAAAEQEAGTGYYSYDQPSYDPTSYASTSWTPPPPPPAAKASKKDRGPRLFNITIALGAIALGVLGVIDTYGAPVVDAAYPALALAVVGVMLVIGSFVGRPGGLIFLGLVASLALVITTAAQEYEWDEQDFQRVAPASAAALEGDYDFFAGSRTIDLTRIADLENLDGRTLDIRGEAGEIRLIVPAGLTVDVDARIGIGGEIDVDGVRDEGRNPSLLEHLDGGEGAPDMTIDIDLTVGSIDVQQEEAA